MKKSAIITGISGQDGPYLAKLLLEKNYNVFGILPRHSSPNIENLRFLGLENKIELITGDVTDENSMYRLIHSIRPDEFYNLAAQSFVGDSWELSKVTTNINAVGTLNILNAIRCNHQITRFYQASTSEMFGNSNLLKQNELTPFKPTSPYATSKLYAYWTTVNYRDSYNLYTSNGILFNHESPIRGKQFVTRKVTDAVAKIKLGLEKNIFLGNINSKRDWGFAGDYVEAMWLMLQQKKPDDFVIASGKQYSIKDLLKIAFTSVGINNWKNYVKIDGRFKRPSDLHSLCGDSSKARKQLGWKPKTNFKKLIELMVREDIKRYKQHIISNDNRETVHFDKFKRFSKLSKITKAKKIS